MGVLRYEKALYLFIYLFFLPLIVTQEHLGVYILVDIAL